MRILYGVVGEGMGHAIRSRVLIDELLRQGHDIKVMASSRACDYLSERYGEEVKRIHGLHLIYEENRVRRGKTLWTNVQAGCQKISLRISNGWMGSNRRWLLVTLSRGRICTASCTDCL